MQNKETRKTKTDERTAIKLVYRSWLVVCLSFSVLHAQTAPPTLLSVSPNGGTRGTKTTVLIDGTNIGKASKLLFSSSGFNAVIGKHQVLPNKRPKPAAGVVITGTMIPAARHRLTVEIAVDPAVEPGVYAFRLQTPLGTTDLANFAVTPFPEVEEYKTNNTIDDAQFITLPVTVKGEITEFGDQDHFSFKARAGQDLVFEILASALGSRLNSTLTLVDRDGKVVASNDDFNGRDSLLTYKVKQSGVYIIRVSDAQLGSGAEYRLQAGELPYVTEIFPLGVRAGRNTRLKISGHNLPQAPTGEQTISVVEEKAGWGKTIPISVPGAWNKPQIAVGAYPEELEREPNNTMTGAQRISVPVTINGRISGPPSPDEDLFQFTAGKGQHLLIEVEAQRLGSALDSVVEVLDVNGQLVPRATLRCLAQTAVVFSDPDSLRAGIRIESWNDFAINDYVMIGGELLRVQALPAQPDDDTIFKSFRGRRIGFEDTTPEAHALSTPVYKVRIFPPGSQFPPNGMPIFHLNYRNDDGDPMYGKDSRLNFVAPTDGTYLVRLRDVRGLEGKRFAYRLTVREAAPAPDFVLFADRENPNVPPGGQIPINVTAYRIDGFGGEIKVSLEDLPEGLTATEAIIPAGADSTVVLLRAAMTAVVEPAPFRIVGRAEFNDQSVVHQMDVEKRLSLVATSAPPDIQVHVASREVKIVPGTEVQFTIRVDRHNDFAWRVPVNVRNLPPGVRVLDIGLNGVLITEEESSRTVTLYAEPWVPPLQQPFYAVGRVETDSLIPVEHSSDPIELVVLPQVADQR